MRRWNFCLLAGGLLIAAALSFVYFAFFVCLPEIERQYEDAPRVQAVVIADAVERYHLLHEKYPDHLEDLTKPDSKLDGTTFLRPNEILDPWGKPYHAEFPQDEKGKVRIWTTSPSGEMIANEKKRVRSPSQ